MAALAASRLVLSAPATHGTTSGFSKQLFFETRLFAERSPGSFPIPHSASGDASSLGRKSTCFIVDHSSVHCLGYGVQNNCTEDFGQMARTRGQREAELLAMRRINPGNLLLIYRHVTGRRLMASGTLLVSAEMIPAILDAEFGAEVEPSRKPR